MQKIALWMLCAVTAISSTHHVSVTGSDLNPGTLDNPFKTIAKAVSSMASGDTVFIHAGDFVLSTTLSISTSQNGTAEKKNCLLAYPGDRPLLDFSNSPLGSKGIKLAAQHWLIRGLDIKGAGDNGLEINGGLYNRIEDCAFFENRDTGLQLSNGAAYNQIIHCDSYYNADPPEYADADGFAPKLTVGTGNSFYGCRAWGNCDDGWDGYLRGADNVATTLEQCWTWGNGWLKDGSDPGSQANGNGFKMGGGDNSNSAQLTHHFILKNCLAFGNKAKGFDQNNNAGSMTLLNCTSFGNGSNNFSIPKALKSGQTATIKNCLSYNGGISLGGFIVQGKNSWLAPFVVTDLDFVSLDPSAASATRNPDSSLPMIDFMHLAQGSDLVDSGVPVDIPYLGVAPDLGAFESPFTTRVPESHPQPARMSLLQNHPNPFNPSTTIVFHMAVPGRVVLKIYSLSGQQVATIVEGYRSAGEHHLLWRPHGLSSGVYLCRMQTDHDYVLRKLVYTK